MVQKTWASVCTHHGVCPKDAGIVDKAVGLQVVWIVIVDGVVLRHRHVDEAIRIALKPIVLTALLTEKLDCVARRLIRQE